MTVQKRRWQTPLVKSIDEMLPVYGACNVGNTESPDDGTKQCQPGSGASSGQCSGGNGADTSCTNGQGGSKLQCSAGQGGRK